MSHMFRTDLGKFGENLSLWECPFSYCNCCNVPKVDFSPSKPWSWVCPPGHHGVLRQARAVRSAHCKVCMALIPDVSPGHIETPSRPNLGLSPRLKSSLCRGRGGTCRPTSEANPSTMYRVTASGFAEPGVAEVKENSLDQDRPQLLRHIPDSCWEMAKNSAAVIYWRPSGATCWAIWRPRRPSSPSSSVIINTHSSPQMATFGFGAYQHKLQWKTRGVNWNGKLSF